MRAGVYSTVACSQLTSDVVASNGNWKTKCSWSKISFSTTKQKVNPHLSYLQKIHSTFTPMEVKCCMSAIVSQTDIMPFPKTYTSLAMDPLVSMEQKLISGSQKLLPCHISLWGKAQFHLTHPLPPLCSVAKVLGRWLLGQDNFFWAVSIHQLLQAVAPCLQHVSCCSLRTVCYWLGVRS